MTSNLYLPALPLTLFKCHTKHQGWTPSPAGRGGSPPRPAKMIKTAGKLRGKIKARFSNLSDRGNHWWYNITKLNNAQSSPSIGYSRDTILYILYNPIRRAILVDYRWNKVKGVKPLCSFFCKWGFELCSPKFVNLWNSHSCPKNHPWCYWWWWWW